MEIESPPTLLQSSYKVQISIVLMSCLMGILMAFLVYDQNFIFGSETGNWTYSYFGSIPALSSWMLFLTLGLLGIVVFIGSRLINVREKTTMLGCFLVSIFFQVLIHGEYPVTLGTIVQSDNANTFYTVAMKYSPYDILSQYDVLAYSFPAHAKTNMPGKIVFYQLLQGITSSPQMMGYLVIFLSTCGGLLLYGICKNLFRDTQAAFYAFTLYILIPGKLFFFPILNTLSPIFILLCLYLLILYVESKKLVFSWLLGFSFYVLIFFEPSPLITGFIFIGVVLHTIREKRLCKKDFWNLIFHTFIAFLCVYLVLYVFFSFDLIGAFRYVLMDAANFNKLYHRPYRLWVVENIKEFFYSAGTPVMVIFIHLVGQIILNWKALLRSVQNWSIENIYIISLLVTFTIVAVLGFNRGEISRLWIYLAVFFQIPSAIFIAKIPKSTVLFFLTASTLVIQSMIALQRVSFINP